MRSDWTVVDRSACMSYGIPVSYSKGQICLNWGSKKCGKINFNATQRMNSRYISWLCWCMIILGIHPIRFDGVLFTGKKLNWLQLMDWLMQSICICAVVSCFCLPQFGWGTSHVQIWFIVPLTLIHFNRNGHLEILVQ